MIKMKWYTPALAVAMLVACGGGGGDSGTSPFTGGGGTKAPTAANLVLQLNKSSVTDNGSEAVGVTVTATDANNNVVADVPVTIAADTNTVVVAQAAKTDASGTVTGSVLVGTANRSNRTVTVTATSGTLVQTATFTVTGASIESTLVPAQVTAGQTASVQYRVTDVNKNPMIGQAISITAFGATTSGTTDVNGRFEFDYTAPATAGTYAIAVSAAGKSQSDSVTVAPAGTTPPPVPANSIISESVDASPSVVGVNTAGSTTNAAAIRALFLGANNSPISGVRVRFDLDGDLNNIGGTFSTGTTIVYSNSLGAATTFYFAGDRSSPTNGVTIRACYGYTDADLANGACPNFVTTQLTVVSQPISVSIGTNRQLIDNTLTYIQEFVVTVVDGSGKAMSDVEITPSVDILRFGKGRWVSGASGWTQQPVQSFTNANGTPWYLEDPRPVSEQVSDPAGAPPISPSAACWNEDRNRNGVLETAEDSKAAGYSLAAGGNGNGKLDPAKSDIAISINGSSKTDASGKVTVRIEYAKNLGSWLEYKILVSAAGVSGTEGRATWTDVLLVLASDVSKANVDPPFIVSRYGVVAGCDNPQ